MGQIGPRMGWDRCMMNPIPLPRPEHPTQGFQELGHHLALHGLWVDVLVGDTNLHLPPINHVDFDMVPAEIKLVKKFYFSIRQYYVISDKSKSELKKNT